MQKLVVLCDGTWCGSETHTRTNIFQLAKLIGIFSGDDDRRYDPERATPISYPNDAVAACYFPGAGLGGSFLEYLVNGATANDIDEECIRVYRYIVQYYTRQHEVWMFGFSRGAYIVRCVAGMINNCGILKRRDDNGNTVLTNNNANLTVQEEALCIQVYRIYRSKYSEDNPEGSQSDSFRKRASHDMPTPPIKFMGLFDTVGSLGIPYFNPGSGLKYREFYDTKISGVVEKVYHALSIHDRMWGLEPCHALPASDRNGPQFEIHERWFPGCHYDLGRQRFQFLRNGSDRFERWVGNILSPLSNVIEPNHVFADLVLKWMLEKIQLHDPQGTVIPHIDIAIDQLITSMTNSTVDYTGSGDVYDNLPAFGPAGRLWGPLTSVFPVSLFPGFTDTINALTQTRDRIISDPTGELTLYDQPSLHLGGRSVGDLGRIGPTLPLRYPSQTYEVFNLSGIIPAAGSSPT